MSKKNSGIGRTAKTYGSRNAILAEMGYVTYLDYLASDLWLNIRDNVLAKSKVCSVCRGVANQIYHRVYTRDVLEGNTLEHLLPICTKCFNEALYQKNGRKLTLRDSQNKFTKMLNGTRIVGAGTSRPEIGLFYKKKQKLKSKGR